MSGREGGRKRLWADFKATVGRAAETPHEPADGGHHWLCPSHITKEAEDKADRIGNAMRDAIELAVAADDLGSVSELYSALWEDTDESSLDGEGKGQRWIELMCMSLGYWLDCLVMNSVVEETGATAEEVHDVAMLRELIRHETMEEVALGRMAARLAPG